MNKQLRGIAVCAGYGMGHAHMIRQATPRYEKKRTGSAQDERARLEQAIKTFREESDRLIRKMKENATDKEAQILEGHLLFVSDPAFTSQIDDEIAGGASAESAVAKVCDDFAAILAQTDDPLLIERAADARDLRGRLIDALSGENTNELETLPENTILAAEELTPSMTARLDLTHVVGIVTKNGAAGAHAAILARAMSIPSVCGLGDDFSAIADGDPLIVDGCGGIVYIDPPQKTQKEYRALHEQYLAEQKELCDYKDRESRTKDGTKLPVCANIGSPEQAHAAKENGAEGIGLFRTEFLFMEREAPPDEDEQYHAYCAAARAAGVPIVIRTLDVGGDKNIPYLDLAQEENPFLGLRGIRFTLSRPELFRCQLRAILRAGAEYDVSAMLPMICDMEELSQAREMLNEEARALGTDPVPLGIMIETPAAVLCATELARAADFFSIGTNDLTGYLLCADRGNPAVTHLYSALSPAVLRAIRHTVSAAHAAGIPVSVCGEAASDPLLLPYLIGCEVDKLSVSPAAILHTRRNIGTHSLAAARALTEHALMCESRQESTRLLSERAETE